MDIEGTVDPMMLLGFGFTLASRVRAGVRAEELGGQPSSGKHHAGSANDARPLGLPRIREADSAKQENEQYRPAVPENLSALAHAISLAQLSMTQTKGVFQYGL